MATGSPPRAVRIRRISQIALGTIWLIDGALQCQPVMFGKAFVAGVILPNASGQPPALAAPIIWIAHQIEPHVALFNAIAASLQVMIGVGLMYKRTVRLALGFSFAWSLSIWFVGEGLGGILTGTANPLSGAPGAALLYIIVGIMVWPRTGEGVRGERLAWAALWLSSAALWLLPVNDSANSVHDAIASAPTGVGWLRDLLRSAANASGGHGSAIAIAMGATSMAIAVSTLTGLAQRTFLGVAIALSLAFWVFGQGVGGILTGTATDVSTGPLVVVMGCLLLAHQHSRHPPEPQSVESSRVAISAA